MKKILMYSTSKIYSSKRITGGIKRFNMLYDGLIKNGYDVDLYCDESLGVLKKYNKNAKSINSVNKKNKLLFPNISIFIKNIKLLKKLKKMNYDNVIVFDVPTAISICILKFKNVDLFLRQDLIEYRKIILEEKNKGKIYNWIYLKFMNFCEYICCKNSSKIIIQCKADFDNLVARHKNIKDDIIKKTIIQINNVNAPWITEKSKIDVPKEESKNFKIGFIGDFSNPRKGHDIFLSACKKLLLLKENIEVFVMGDGKSLDKYKNLYQNYENIKFLGRTNAIEIIKKMDLVVVPSLADSCPNTVLESIYNDILVIGSNKGGIPEIINNEDSLFEPNVDALFELISKIKSNKIFKDKLYNLQEKRKKELCFNWEEKIINIIMN